MNENLYRLGSHTLNVRQIYGIFFNLQFFYKIFTHQTH